MKNGSFSGLSGVMWPVPSGCIGIHTVKIYQARSRQFFRWFVAILPVCCRDRAERVLAVRTIKGIMVNPLTVCPRSHRDKPQKSCQPAAWIFRGKVFAAVISTRKLSCAPE